MSYGITWALPRPVGGFGFSVRAEEALEAGGWLGVQQTLAGVLALIDGVHGGDAVAWCGLMDGPDVYGQPARLLGVVFTWSTDAVGEDTARAMSKAMAAGLGASVRVEGPQGPADGFFPTVAILGGTLHRVRLPQEPEPVLVWAARDPEGAVGLFGGRDAPEDVALIDAPEAVLSRAEETGEDTLDRDEALFLVHAAGRLAQVVDSELVIRWMQRRLGPVLADEGLLEDDGSIDTEAVREAVTDAVEALRARPPEARRRLVHLLGEPLVAEGGISEAAAAELAMAMSALGLVGAAEEA